MIRVHCKKGWQEYTFSELFSAMGVPFSTRGKGIVSVYYGSQGKGQGIFIPYSKVGKNPEVKFLEGGIPVLGKCSSPKGKAVLKYKDGSAAACIRGKSIHLGFDIISSAFYFLSRQEEISGQHDIMGRYPAGQSLAFRKGFLERPVVNEYCQLLCKLLKELGVPLARKCQWPGRRSFCICLTHDVDILTPSMDWKGSGSLLGLPRTVRQKYKPFLLFSNVLNIEKRFGCKSSFYFCTQKGHDLHYELKDVKGLIEMLSGIGMEIGLHASIESGDLVGKEKDKLERFIGKPVSGVRNHYLMFDVEKTWGSQEKCGFEYDTSLGFAKSIGFRAGAAFPFHPYSFVKKRGLRMLELPLGIMDTALFRHMGLKPEQAIERAMELLKRVRNCNGLLTVLWHQNYFGADSYWSKGYESVLEYGSEHNAWLATAKEVADWWCERGSFRLESWKKSGSGVSVVYKAVKDVEGVCFVCENTAGVEVKGAGFRTARSKGIVWVELDKISKGSRVEILLRSK